MRKVIVFIASSLDGYIAGPGDSLEFLDKFMEPGQDYGYGDFMKTVDTVIMGRKTYDKVMTMVDEFPHKSLESYIITRGEGKKDGNTAFYNGNLCELLLKLKMRDGKNIFVDGGAEIIHELLKNKMIDEFIITIAPELLGEGVRLFKDERPPQSLTLLGIHNFPSGLVQVRYRVNND